MIADGVLRISAVLLAGLAIRSALVRQSAALRHGVVAITLLCALLVIPAGFVLPAWTLAVPAVSSAAPAPPQPEVTVVATSTSGTAAAVHSAPWPALRPALWASGFLAIIGVLIAGIFRLHQIAARGRPVDAPAWTDAARTIAASYGLRREIALIEGASPFVVATWGLRRPRLLLPPGASSSWSDDRIRAVLCHELAHVARADWAVQIASQIALAVLWFHPLAWLACRQLRRDSERACDDAVLGYGVTAPEYASHLVALARVCRRPAWSVWMPALPMARPSAFERRIAAMLKPGLDRRPLSLRAVAAVALLLAGVTAGAASAHARQAPADVSGTVYDPSGGIIPGVTLTLSAAGQRTVSVSTSRGLNIVSEPAPSGGQATTDSAGRFSFAGVAPGRYILTASLPGFHELREEFDLKAAADWDRVVTLQVGTLQETISVSATRTFAAPATGPVPIRVGGNIRVPVKLQDVRPVYPESMRAEGREAEVQLEATINRDGAVSALRVLSSQIHPDFAVAASDAVRQWRFRPTLLNGKPIDVVMTVTVRFSLAD